MNQKTNASVVATGTERSTTARRVLVAEDEALIRLDLIEMLSEEGYVVVGEAADGQQAVEQAEVLRPDLVIMDVKMPKMDGIDAASIIAERRLAPVVILTAFSQRDLVERARDAGAMAYLVKPFSITDLIPAIELAVSRFGEISALESEVATLSDRLETRICGRRHPSGPTLERNERKHFHALPYGDWRRRPAMGRLVGQ